MLGGTGGGSKIFIVFTLSSLRPLSAVLTQRKDEQEHDGTHELVQTHHTRDPIPVHQC